MTQPEPEPLTPNHLAVLRAIDAAGGTLSLARIVDVIDPGTSAAPLREFARRSIPCVRIASDLQRLGLIERRLLSNERVLTDAGRAALASRVGACTVGKFC